MRQPRHLVRRAGLLVGLAVVLAGAFWYRISQRDSVESRDRAKLVAAVGERRMLHGRATGGFAFGPAPGRKRGSAERVDAPFEVLSVAAELRSRFEARPTAAAIGNLALAHLVVGDSGRAVRLAELRALEEPTPEALVDLSAAFLQRAVRDHHADDYAHAFDSALRALRLQPGRHEALFNRALALDGLDLAWMARQAWEEYLAADSASPWSNVAREALLVARAREAENNRAVNERPRILAAWADGRMDVVREIASRRPDLAREIVRREAIPAVARAKIDGRSLAPSLAIARELNAVAEATDRDALDREALAHLERGDRELAAAHISFAKASQELDDREIDRAAPRVFATAAVFRKKGTPYAELGELQSALADFFVGRRQGLTARYTRLIGRNSARYPLLRARAHWMRGLCEGLLSADEWRAFLDRREAFEILSEARQIDTTRQIAGQLWASLRRLGREAEASRLLPAVTSSLSVEGALLRTLAAIENLSEYLADRGLLTAALEVRKRSENAQTAPTLRANTALEVAQLASALGDGAAVRHAIELGARSLADIEDKTVRLEMEIQFELAALAAGTYLQTGTPARVDGLVTRLRERGSETQLKMALTLIGEARLAEGKAEEGEPPLREALSLYVAERAGITAEFERIKTFERAERTADNLVDLLSLTGRHEEALHLGEQLRNPARSRAPGIGHVTRRLAPGDAVLNYWTLPNRILVTVLTAEGTEHVVLPVARASIHTLVQRLNRAIEVESDALVTAALVEIHGALIRPVEYALRSSRRLWIVPDRDLWDVPFAGLSAPDGTPLTSRFEIAFSSSLENLARTTPMWVTPVSILAVGNPSWNPDLFGDLPPLPESLAEARAVAALYPRGRVLGGREATRRAVQQLAPQADVVHIATHAIANDRDPGESFLLFSTEGSDPGPWRASEPGWEALSRARLVVLSACRTGAQWSRFGGASLGVLRSIQLSSEAQVLASTGDVDDAASRRLLEAFHRHLRVGGTPAAALRKAQIEAHRERSGMTWMLYRIVI